MYRKTPVKAFGQRNLPKPVEQSGRRANLLANALAEKQTREAEERRQAEAALRLKEERAAQRRQKALSAVRWPVEQSREVARKAAEPVQKLAQATEHAGERLVNLSKAAGQASKDAAKNLGEAGKEAAHDVGEAGWGIAKGVAAAGRKAGKGVGGAAAGAAGGLGQAGKGIAAGVSQAGKGVAGGVRKAGKGVSDGAKDLGKGIAGGVRLTGSGITKAVEGAGHELSVNLRDLGKVTQLSLRNVGEDINAGLRDTGREISGGLEAARLSALKTGEGVADGLRNTQRTVAENLRDASDITRLTFLDVGQGISDGLRDRSRELSDGLDGARKVAQRTGEGVTRGLRDAHREVSQNLREAGEITRASFLDVGKDVTDGWRDRRQEVSDGFERARRVAGTGLLLTGQGIAAGWRVAYGGVAANLRDANEITRASFRDLGHDITEGGLDRLREARAAAALAQRIADLGLRTIKKIDLSPVAQIPGHVSRRAAIVRESVDSGVRRGASGLRGALVIAFMLPVRLSRVLAAAMRLAAVRLASRWHAVLRSWHRLTQRIRSALARRLADIRRALAWSGVWLRPAAVAGMAVLAVIYAGSVTTHTVLRNIFDRPEVATEPSAGPGLVAENTVPADVERHPLILPPAPVELPPIKEVAVEDSAVAEANTPDTAASSVSEDSIASQVAAAETVPEPKAEKPEAPAQTQVAEARSIPPVTPQRKPARRNPPAPAPAADGIARVAIVIDDMGMDRRMLSRFAALPGEITFAFLPYAPHLDSQTREALKAGHQLIVHMPMEPKDAATDPGRNALLTGLTTAELERRIAWNLDRFNGFVGINNHMGSKFTEDAASMSLVMAMLHQRGLFYLDSLTTSASAGYRLAGAAGVPRVRRDVFLDNEQDVDAILRQLRETQRIAGVVGKSIAIGHPHRQTLEALKRWIPEAQAAGVRLVSVGSLVPAPTPRVASATAGQP